MVYLNNEVKLKGFFVLTLFLAFSTFAQGDCSGRQLCPGSRVLSPNETTGTVLEVFSNGMVTVKFDAFAGTHTRSEDSLSKAKRCVSGICVSHRILSSNDTPGEIREVFTNGKATMTFEGYSGLYVRHVSTLGLSTNCLATACTGDRVISSNGTPGTILEIFDSGRAKIRFDGYSGTYLRGLSDLGHSVTCSLGNPCRRNRDDSNE